jgi:hypothetical protein
MVKKKNHPSEKVEFRVRHHEKEWLRRLAEEADNAGRSIGDHARELVKRQLSLQDDTLNQINSLQHQLTQVLRKLEALSTVKEGLKRLHENVYELRDDLPTLAVMLLIHLARMTPDQATQSVREHFPIQP